MAMMLNGKDSLHFIASITKSVSDTINNKPLGIVAAVGNGDQRIYLDKSNGLIVVFTAGNYNNRNNVKNSYAILKDYIYPALLNKWIVFRIELKKYHNEEYILSIPD